MKMHQQQSNSRARDHNPRVTLRHNHVRISSYRNHMPFRDAGQEDTPGLLHHLMKVMETLTHQSLQNIAAAFH
jgi:hypothetical protein